jgi:hypothetical protein
MKVFSSRKFFFFLLLMFFAAVFFLHAQEHNSAAVDPSSYVGFTLEKLFEELGMPTSVHAVRGNEFWQDDVVFVYPSIEIYIFKDRVWQVCPVSVYNMNMGDSVDQIKMTMGEPLIAAEQYFLYRLPSQAWPMMFRINLDQEKKAASFFMYRADF